ncbi:MAG: hypothetical protein LKK19_03190 [Bacteroidales bacterium]|nr:hypothetical protein [Bacteroidales bacterium]MCI2121691.1 hypothetical protein [Bacteroidales bacterium]MCI2144884.1 hypothetical protein [Bacteroidales bacterium]
MKKRFIFLFFTVLTTVLPVLFSGCSRDIKGTLYSGEGGFGFSSSVLNVESTAEDDGKILVPVYRSTLDGGNEVRIGFAFYNNDTKEYQTSDPDNNFSLTTSKVVFADDSYESHAQIRFADLSAMGISEKHRMKLTILGDVGPAGDSVVTITVNRKLTFDYLGEGLYHDEFLFYDSYPVDIYSAREAEIIRIMDPYTEGLVKEEYVANGCSYTPDSYVDIFTNSDSTVYFAPIAIGFLYEGTRKVYAYYPGDYTELDYTSYSKDSRWTDSKTINLSPIYAVPDYGHFDVFPITIDLP